MAKITKTQLTKILAAHAKWLNDNGRGKRAYLAGVNLSGVNLSEVKLFRAYMSGADLREADLFGADLRGANLCDADLSGADLCGANLTGANLTGAKLDNVKVSHITAGFALVCPEKGSFTAFKITDEDRIVELNVPARAKRSSATTRKCRVSEAKVISITSLDGKKHFKKARATFDHDFLYEVGKTVKVKNFDPDRWNECSTGIHCFITRDEAVNYI